MEDNILNDFLNLYKPGNDLVKANQEIIKAFTNKLPKPIIDLWTKYGFGSYGDGIIKVINPLDYMNSLFAWLGKRDFTKIPIFITAFGDIFYYRQLTETENDISLLNIHTRKISVCGYSYQEFFTKYINSDIMNYNLRKDLFNQAKETIGILESKEIYFFVPALILGGAENIKYIKKGNAVTHQFLLLELGKQK